VCVCVCVCVLLQLPMKAAFVRERGASAPSMQSGGHRIEW